MYATGDSAIAIAAAAVASSNWISERQPKRRKTRFNSVCLCAAWIAWKLHSKTEKHRVRNVFVGRIRALYSPFKICIQTNKTLKSCKTKKKQHYCRMQYFILSALEHRIRAILGSQHPNKMCNAKRIDEMWRFCVCVCLLITFLHTHTHTKPFGRFASFRSFCCRNWGLSHSHTIFASQNSVEMGKMNKDNMQSVMLTIYVRCKT